MTNKPKFTQQHLNKLCAAANSERAIRITNMIAKRHNLQGCSCGPNKKQSEVRNG